MNEESQSPLEAARGILGEHFRNYVIIVQDDDQPALMDCVYSAPFATTGLILEASKYHQAQMNAIGTLDNIEWVYEEVEDDDEEEEM